MLDITLDDHIERYLNRIADHMVGLKPHTTTDLEIILDHLIIEEARRRGVADDYFDDKVRMRSIKLSDKAEEMLNEIMNYAYGKDRDHTIDYESTYFEKRVKFDHMELTAMLERVEKAKEEQARRREEEIE